jgi:hypothetical protein
LENKVVGGEKEEEEEEEEEWGGEGVDIESLTSFSNYVAFEQPVEIDLVVVDSHPILGVKTYQCWKYLIQ